MMRAPLSVGVEGVAFWTPQLPDWNTARAVMRGEGAPAQPSVARPAPDLLAPTERRRAPDSVAVALEVAVRACQAAQRAPQELPAVFASTYGDLAISDYMCATLAATPTLLSPTKFHNSVHNAAAGYWSIGTASFTAYTALSASCYTFASGLLEAIIQATCDRTAVLYVAFDTEAKGPIATVAPSRGLLGVAVIVAPPGGERCERTLEVTIAPAAGNDLTRAASAVAQLISGNALTPCLPFFEVLAGSAPGAVTLGLSEHTAMKVQLR